MYGANRVGQRGCTSPAVKGRLAGEGRDERVACTDPEEQRVGPERTGEQLDETLKERELH